MSRPLFWRRGPSGGGGPLPQPQGGTHDLLRTVRRNPFFTSVTDLLIGFQMFMLEDLMTLNCGRHSVTMRRTKCQQQQDRKIKRI